MRKSRLRRSTTTLACIALAGCTFVLLASAAVRALVPKAESQSITVLLVVAHPSSTNESFDRDALRTVFLRRRLTWDSGTRILPFNYPAGHPIRVTFDRAVLGMNQDEVARFWIDARIRSGIEAPRSLPSPQLMARVVAQLAGSIGYVPEDQPVPGARVLARITPTEVLAP